ncbi:hypothetical protein ACFQVC_34310 [Streptomyces monticola]|uniref:Uncharacterized protein n=1 Tax=Streptomyces monticola TaxID=2666263 RepID=A0ABW2JSV9_9ACTN
MGSIRLDEIVAGVVGQVSAEDVAAAAQVSSNLDEDSMTFGPVNMFALDK